MNFNNFNFKEITHRAALEIKATMYTMYNNGFGLMKTAVKKAHVFSGNARHKSCGNSAEILS